MSLQHYHLDACATLTPLIASFHGIWKRLSALSGMTAPPRSLSNFPPVDGNKTGKISTSAVVCLAPTDRSARLFTHPMEWTRTREQRSLWVIRGRRMRLVWVRLCRDMIHPKKSSLWILSSGTWLSCMVSTGNIYLIWLLIGMPMIGPGRVILQVTLSFSLSAILKGGENKFWCLTGAFALFGPSQFSTLFPLVVQPVKGILHFAGEATSVHHAYVLFCDDRGV